MVRAAFAVGILATATAAAAPATAHGPARAKRDQGPALPAGALVGEWWTEAREGRVRFERARDGTYRARTSWRARGPDSNDAPILDRNNPNPKLRARKVLGIVLIWNLTFDDGEYEGGYVYNPRDGDTYRFEAELLDPDTLKIRGYLGISLLGQSQIWKRYKPAQP
jgi:uncharacterized protein (DUF2147 family)